MWIKIFPNDTLFFRSGRPFSMGFETWADNIFPPYPSTIYGALRTFLIFERGSLKDFKQGNYEDIGTRDKKGTMKIIGPLMFDLESNALCFPTPLDLIKEKDNKNKEFLNLHKTKKPKISYTEEKTEEVLIYKEKEQVEPAEGYLDSITLKEYLQRQREKYLFISKNELFTLEHKIGITRNDTTFISKEEHLYAIPMVRLKKQYGFLVKIENVKNVPEKGIFLLGGEGKTACFEKIDDDLLDDLNEMNFELKDKTFKIYIATSTIFKKGWIPEWIDENSTEGEKDGIKLKLIACAIGKFIRIGGWDMAKGEPKPMYKAVPAGSVYYFKVLNDATADNVKQVFHFKNISDINPEEGFGLSFVGVV